MGRALFARRIGRDGAELQAVARESHVAFHPGVVERGRILPARQHVQVLAVVHRVEPLTVLVAQVLGVAAGENPSGQVPVIELAVDDHLPRRGQDADADVFGFRGERRSTQRTRDNEQQVSHEQFSFHISFHII